MGLAEGSRVLRGAVLLSPEPARLSFPFVSTNSSGSSSSSSFTSAAFSEPSPTGTRLLARELSWHGCFSCTPRVWPGSPLSAPSLAVISEATEHGGSQMVAIHWGLPHLVRAGSASLCSTHLGSAASATGGRKQRPREGQKHPWMQMPAQLGWQRPHPACWVNSYGGEGREWERTILFQCLDLPRLVLVCSDLCIICICGQVGYSSSDCPISLCISQPVSWDANICPLSGDSRSVIVSWPLLPNGQIWLTDLGNCWALSLASWMCAGFFC